MLCAINKLHFKQLKKERKVSFVLKIRIYHFTQYLFHSRNCSISVKFSFSEKVTKICAIVLMVLTFTWRSDKTVSRLACRRFSQKINKRICFFCFFTLHGKKTQIRSFVFLGESTARKSTYGFIWPLVNVKTMRKMAQIFVAFSEKLNFNKQLNSP